MSLAGGAAKKAFPPVSERSRHQVAGRAGISKADLSPVQSEQSKNNQSSPVRGLKAVPIAILAGHSGKIRTQCLFSEHLSLAKKAVLLEEFSAELFSKAAQRPIRNNIAAAV